MTESTERAVLRLTEPHTEMTEAGPVEWPALIDWLDDSIREVVGRGGGGSGGAGLPFNTEALALLNHIDGRLRLILGGLGEQRTGDRKFDVTHAWTAAKTHRAQGMVDDVQWENICDEFPDWVHRIEAEDDRPRKIELTVACPRCEKRWVLDDGNRVAAVRIELRAGGAPIAECREEECRALWVGWDALTELGFVVGANMDLEVLAACGIDLRRQLAS